MRTDPRIHFETKEESNARRRREFLELTPWERMVYYLRDIQRNPPGHDERGEAKGNFIIWKRVDEVRG
ncbi:MAG: hypothetical protein IPP33_18445 [Flavobacteriales bacterium]|nr:hypothetical protein [Flavobacteriales bacterium]